MKLSQLEKFIKNVRGVILQGEDPFVTVQGGGKLKDSDGEAIVELGLITGARLESTSPDNPEGLVSNPAERLVVFVIEPYVETE